MANFTVQEILDIAAVSEYLAANDVAKGSLFSQRLDPRLPLMLYMERKAVYWAYSQTPTYTDIVFTSNYLYALCGKYALSAQWIINGGGGGTPVVPITPTDDCTGLVHITSADFEGDGVTVVDGDWNNKILQIFWNDIPRFIYDPTEWSYVIGGGFKILIPGFDASVNDYNLYVFVGCFNPGAAQYVPASGSQLKQTSFDGDGVTTVFLIPHLITGVPNYTVQPVGDDSAGEFSSTADATDIIITYNVAPPIGTENVIFDWGANAP